MLNLTDINYVKGIQSDMRATFETEAGKNSLKFLELACGWYQSPIVPGDRQMTDLNAGRREVLATIKTMLEFPAEQIVSMSKEKEDQDG